MLSINDDAAKAPLIPKAAANKSFKKKLKRSMHRASDVSTPSYFLLLLQFILILAGASFAAIALKSMYEWGEDGGKLLGFDEEMQKTTGVIAYASSSSLASLAVEFIVPRFLNGARNFFVEERYRDVDFYPWFLIKGISLFTIFIPAGTVSAYSSFEKIKLPFVTNIADASSITTNSTFSWELLPEDLLLFKQERAKVLARLIKYFSNNLTKFLKEDELIDFYVAYRDANDIEARTKLVIEKILEKVGEDIYKQLIAKHPGLKRYVNKENGIKALYLLLALSFVYGVSLTWDSLGSIIPDKLYLQFPGFYAAFLKLYGNQWNGFASMGANSLLTLFSGLKVLPTLKMSALAVKGAFNESIPKGVLCTVVALASFTSCFFYGLSQYALSKENLPSARNDIFNGSVSISMGAGAAAQATFGFSGFFGRINEFYDDCAWNKVLTASAAAMKQYNTNPTLRRILQQKLKRASNNLARELEVKSANRRVGVELIDDIYDDFSSDTTTKLEPPMGC